MDRSWKSNGRFVKGSKHPKICLRVPRINAFGGDFIYMFKSYF